jgi:hypothetical protein
VLQALYFCRPFRDCLASYSYPHSSAILSALSEDIYIPELLPPPAPSNIHPRSASHTSLSSLPKASPRSVAATVPLGSPSYSHGNQTTSSFQTRNSHITSQAELESLKIFLSKNVDAMHPAEKNEETLLTTLQDLFARIGAQKKRVGCLGPTQFVAKLKKDNGTLGLPPFSL